MIRQLMLKVLSWPIPLRVVIARKVVKRLSLFSYAERLMMGAVERPHYGHCIYEAAKLAARLKYPEISVIEFGCGGGNGLLNAETHINEIEKVFSVKIQLYGFDNAAGLPLAKDYRDYPHYFRPGQFRMDMDALRKRLGRAKLVLGDVEKTCQTFFNEYSPAPVGAILHDLDFYSSTRAALQIFEADSTYFLPRVFMYFDDIKGNNIWLPCEYTGELLAINEFNKGHAMKKVVPNQVMSARYWDQWWADQIFVYHDFQHPDYNVFVGGAESASHDANIELR
jgi:hypothetical protein